jgi:hypothetical protein
VGTLAEPSLWSISESQPVRMSTSIRISWGCWNQSSGNAPLALEDKAHATPEKLSNVSTFPLIIKNSWSRRAERT